MFYFNSDIIGTVRCVQYTFSCVARHVPKRPHGAKAIHRQSVISSDREAAASFDEVGLSVAVRAASQPSSPRNVGEADTGREARCVGGDGNTRAEASKSGVGPLLASLAVILLILFSLAEGEAVRIGIIRIIEATGEVRCVQYTSSCVARHVPKRQNGAKAIHRQSVISSDREAAASFDEVGLSVAVRNYGRWSGGNTTPA